MVLTRLQKVQNLVVELKLDALIIDAPVDLYYLTGLKLSSGRLIVMGDNATLYVDGRYLEAAQKKAPCQVLPVASIELKKGRVGFDAEVTTFYAASQMQKMAETLIPLDAPIKKIRQVKEEKEIELLKQAANLGSLGFDEVLKRLKLGISEIEIARELEIFWLQNGGEKVSFDPIIAFGPNSSQPHYRAAAAKLKQDDTVLIDIGVMKESYASDMTRVTFFGKPSLKMKEIYKVVKEAQLEAIAKCKPGTLIKEIDGRARKVIDDSGYGAYFPHSLGHGVGLEVHEYPMIRSAPPFEDMAIEKGMVFTIEPGIYLPGEGGVRLEDTIVITETGCESLTNRQLL